MYRASSGSPFNLYQIFSYWEDDLCFTWTFTCGLWTWDLTLNQLQRPYHRVNHKTLSGVTLFLLVLLWWKSHYTGKWEDVFFSFSVSESQGICPHGCFIAIHYSLFCCSFPSGRWMGWGSGLNLRVLVYEWLLYSCTLSDGIQNGGREGAVWVLKCIVFRCRLFLNQNFIFLFQQVVCSLWSVLHDFVHSAR